MIITHTVKQLCQAYPVKPLRPFILLDIAHLIKKEYFGYEGLTREAIVCVNRQFPIIAVMEYAEDVEARFGHAIGSTDQRVVDDLWIRIKGELEEEGVNVVAHKGILFGDILASWRHHAPIAGCIAAKRYAPFITDDFFVGTVENGIIELDTLAREFPVPFHRLEQLFALIGDHRFKGVKGIGIKTGVSLLRDYGSIQGIYRQKERLSASMQAKLTAGYINVSRYIANDSATIYTGYDEEVLALRPEYFTATRLDEEEEDMITDEAYNDIPF